MLNNAEDCMLATSHEDNIFTLTLTGWHTARDIAPYTSVVEHEVDLIAWMTLRVQQYIQRNTEFTATTASCLAQIVDQLVPATSDEVPQDSTTQSSPMLDMLPTIVFLPSDEALTERIDCLESSICARQFATTQNLPLLQLARRFNMTAEAFEMTVFLLLQHRVHLFGRLCQLAHQTTPWLSATEFADAALCRTPTAMLHRSDAQQPSWLENTTESVERLAAR